MMFAHHCDDIQHNYCHDEKFEGTTLNQVVNLSSPFRLKRNMFRICFWKNFGFFLKFCCFWLLLFLVVFAAVAVINMLALTSGLLGCFRGFFI